MAVSRSATTSRAIAARLVGAKAAALVAICEYASRSAISVRMRVAASSIRSRYWRALPSEERSSRRAQALAERYDLAQRLLEVVRCDERELVQRRVRSLELAALNGEESLGEASLGHVFDRQKNQP